MNEVEVLKLQVKLLQEQVSLLTQELRAVQSVVRADSLRIRDLEQTNKPSQVGFGHGYERPR